MMLLDGLAVSQSEQSRDWSASGPADAKTTAVYLQPGELHADRRPCTVTTIVGSCVAVCLHDRETGIGGVNHYLLPYRLQSDIALRYGVVAIPHLIHEVLRLGARQERLVAKVFGGACVLAALRPRAQLLGAENVDLALRLLAESRIPVIAQDVEGTRARKIVFRTDSGSVWLKKL